MRPPPLDTCGASAARYGDAPGTMRNVVGAESNQLSALFCVYLRGSFHIQQLKASESSGRLTIRVTST